MTKYTKSYAISEIRTTLYYIVQDIFIDSFHLKYQQYLEETENQQEDITTTLLEESSTIDILVGELVYNRHNPVFLKQLIQNQPSKIIAALYIRYYWLSNYFISLNQEDTLVLPTIPEDFFTELLINYWLKVLPMLPQ